MAQEEQFKECSFFLVHYVPDVVRGEYLNIGVLLYSPKENYLGCLFTDDLRRVKRFHPRADLDLMRELQQDFEQQIDEHSDNLESYLQWMEQAYSNMLQIAPARTCLLRNPEAEIQELFERYVGPRVEGPLPMDTRLRVKQRMRMALVRANVWERLEKRVPVERWTQPGDPFTFDFGYRPIELAGKPNGHIKLIHALSLKRDAELAKVLVYTMEHVRRHEPAELTAVVEGPAAGDDEAANLSRSILQDGGITILPVTLADEYAQSIRRELVI